MTELNYKKIREELLNIYKEYLKDQKNKCIKEKAQGIYSAYWNADSLLDKVLVNAVSKLINIGLDLEPIPSRNEIKEIIKALEDLDLDK